MVLTHSVLIANGNTEIWPVSSRLDSFKIRIKKYKYYEMIEFPDQGSVDPCPRPKVSNIKPRQSLVNRFAKSWLTVVKVTVMNRLEIG